MSHKIIKEGTKKLHASLDQSSFLKNIMSKDVDNNDYLKFLYFHKAVNQLMQDDLEKIYNEYNFPTINRLKLIENDIDNFCQNRKINKKKTPLDSILNNQVTPSIGIVYVMEGARHGNKYILQHLVKNLALTANESSFLAHKSSIEWSVITETLDALKEDELEFNLIQAKNTFKLLIDISNHLNDAMHEEYSL
jgi:heme oxygenase